MKVMIRDLVDIRSNEDCSAKIVSTVYPGKWIRTTLQGQYVALQCKPHFVLPLHRDNEEVVLGKEHPDTLTSKANFAFH